ncbi:hypothetical protein F4554_003703 [Actinopolymorpha rutila]|uniref:Uncharacterized protein n=1 Tax=Actinopolymorpha rutila TaxID=446787 RepID=A0A852ZFX8_9ACTN|nr:hypothetical protein [Actinopolymorpha rutila]
MHPIMIEAVAQAHRDDLLRAAEARRRAAHHARRDGYLLAGYAGAVSGLLQAVAARPHRSSVAGKSPAPCC